MSEHACKVKEAFYDKGRGKSGQLLLSTVDSVLSFMGLFAAKIKIFFVRKIDGERRVARESAGAGGYTQTHACGGYEEGDNGNLT
jgi:hypothetical protein